MDRNIADNKQFERLHVNINDLFRLNNIHEIWEQEREDRKKYYAQKINKVLN